MTAESTCPHCGAKHDRHTSLDSVWAKPKEGSVSFCISCGHFGIFTEDLALREPTEDEMEELLVDPKTKRLLEAFRITMARHIATKREKGEIH